MALYPHLLINETRSATTALVPVTPFTLLPCQKSLVGWVSGEKSHSPAVLSELNISFPCVFRKDREQLTLCLVTVHLAIAQTECIYPLHLLGVTPQAEPVPSLWAELGIPHPPPRCQGLKGATPTAHTWISTHTDRGGDTSPFLNSRFPYLRSLT